jgi:putative Mn2+ efflux pump MntP
MIEAFILALALAMDAFAVALTQGARFRPTLTAGASIAVAFGVAQGVMPLIGWTMGVFALRYVEAWDHWIAFALLSFLGFRMIFGHVEEEGEHRLSGLALLTAAIATSVDALAAGIALPTLSIEPFGAAILIALVTFLLSGFGVWLGRLLGDRFGKPAEILGGAILIGLGLKILAEHTELLA